MRLFILNFLMLPTGESCCSQCTAVSGGRSGVKLRTLSDRSLVQGRQVSTQSKNCMDSSLEQ